MNSATTKIFDLTGQIALVRGAANGIGAAIASRLAGAGASVVVADIDEEAASKTVGAIAQEGGHGGGLPGRRELVRTVAISSISPRRSSV